MLFSGCRGTGPLVCEPIRAWNMAKMLSDLSEEAQRHAKDEKWGLYRNTRYDRAEQLRRNGRWKRAGFLYVEVLILDLQGVSSTPQTGGFHGAYQSPAPSVVREVARFALRAEMGKEELRNVYKHVAKEVWLDAFPRSPKDVWREIHAHVMEEREALALDRKVEVLGPDRLLSEAEAKRYIKRKNPYELVQRVEHILETESPPNIPREKRERAETYLAAVQPKYLADRWKAKALRRGAEVMWSNHGKEKALEYAEAALNVVDPDEMVAIEQMADALRHELDR